MYKVKIVTVCGIRPSEQQVRDAVRLLRGQGFELEFKSICPICHKMPLSNPVEVDGHEYHKKCFKVD